MTLMLLRLCANREQDEQRDGSAHDGLRNVRTYRYQPATIFNLIRADLRTVA